MISPSTVAQEFWENGYAATCPVYDMHGHMGPWPAIYFPRAEPEQMLHSMDQAGVRLLCFSSHEALFSVANETSTKGFPLISPPIKGGFQPITYLPVPRVYK